MRPLFTCFSSSCCCMYHCWWHRSGSVHLCSHNSMFALDSRLCKLKARYLLVHVHVAFRCTPISTWPSGKTVLLVSRKAILGLSLPVVDFSTVKKLYAIIDRIHLKLYLAPLTPADYTFSKTWLLTPTPLKMNWLHILSLLPLPFLKSSFSWVFGVVVFNG